MDTDVLDILQLLTDDELYLVSSFVWYVSAAESQSPYQFYDDLALLFWQQTNGAGDLFPAAA